MGFRRNISIGLGSLLLAALLSAGYRVPTQAGSPPPPARDLPSYLYDSTSPSAAAQTGVSYLYTWSEGPHLTMALWWNAQSEAGCSYASNPWPQGELAASRAFVLGARQVLRDEWDISNWIGQNRAGSSQARIHGTETGCYAGHIDYPPHTHIFYLALDPSGNWLHINSHHYPDANGHIYDNFIIPDMCGQNSSYHQPVNQWLDILDETCTAAWQQRYTSAGDIQMRRNTNAAVYTLHMKAIAGDLATVDVLKDGTLTYEVDITQYDGLAERMQAAIADYRRDLLTTESWRGDPAQGDTLASHTVSTVSTGSGGTPAPTAAPTSTPTATVTRIPTSTPTATATRAPTSTPTATATRIPTSTPTATVTRAPTSTFTAVPTSTPTATPVVQGPPARDLHFHTNLPLLVQGR